MNFEEEASLYSSVMPKQCPGRPPDDFNLDLIQLHIARIRIFFESLAEISDVYFYLVSWNNTALTSLSLIIFVTLCLKFNAEYFGRLVFHFHKNCLSCFLLNYVLLNCSKQSSYSISYLLYVFPSKN